MSFLEMTQHFKCLNVCRVLNWEEVRIKGKFIRVQDFEDQSIEAVLSKWYYSVDLHKPTKLILGIHQEDERIRGVLQRRPYLDTSIAILRRTERGIELYDLKDFIGERECETTVDFEPGSYIILPRTTGCALRRPYGAPTEKLKLSHNQHLHPYLETTIEDIFRKFDMLLNRELTYCEFKGFCECIGR
jgi:calpain-15